MNIPLGPAALVIDRAATMTLGYTLACTDLMHTAAGTLTIELPSAYSAGKKRNRADGVRCVLLKRFLRRAVKREVRADGETRASRGAENPPVQRGDLTANLA